METEVVFMLCSTRQCGRLCLFMRIYCGNAIYPDTSLCFGHPDCELPDPRLGTISGSSQVSLSTSTLMPEDCLATVNLQDIVYISAVPIAAGFGLLLLLAFLRDLRQARKTSRSSSSSRSHIRGNRARKERTYVIDIDYACRSRWGSFLCRCAKHKSPGANKNPRLVRLQGTIGFSDWLCFDLVLGNKSEWKTLITSRSIGKLVAVEIKYQSASDELTSRLLPSSNTRACLHGIINRTCDVEIMKIHAMDTKTQDHYTYGRGSSSSGISDQGITTIIPLLLSSTPPVSRVNYIAYFFKTASLWTSAFTPWNQGNFTGSRHVTCLFACISYTMLAAQVVSKLSLDKSMEDAILVSLTDVNITTAMLVRAIVVGTVVFTVLGFTIETIFRGAPTIWSLHLPFVSPRPQNRNGFADSFLPTRIQSAAGDFYGGSCERVEEGLPRISISAPAMQQQGCRPNGNETQRTNTESSCWDKVSEQCVAAGNAGGRMNYVGNNIEYGTDKVHHAGLTVINRRGNYKLPVENTSPITASSDSNPDISDDTKAKHCFDGTNNTKCNIEPGPTPRHHVAITISDDSFRHNQSICAADDQLECSHKLTCYNWPDCHRTTDSRYYNPRAGCSGENTSSGYDLYNLGVLIQPIYACLSSSLDSQDSFPNNNSTEAKLSKSLSSDPNSWNETSPISSSDLTSLSSGQLLVYPAFYNIQGAIKTKTPDDGNNHDNASRHQTSMPLFKEPSGHRPDSITRAISTSYKTTCILEAGDHSQLVKHLDEGKMKQERFIKYFDALLEPDIKTAKVVRTKNYFNRFSDMGKGKVVLLPYDDTCTNNSVFLSEHKLATKKATGNNKPNLSADKGTKSEYEVGATTIQAPCGPVTAGSDYIVNLPLEFETPSVTIQSSNSNKPFFFSFRKWLSELRSKPKVDIGDDYKLEVLENDVAVNNSYKNRCMPSNHDAAMATSTIQSEAGAKCDTMSTCGSLSFADEILPNIPDNNTIKAKMIDDHLKRSIFQSSSRLIEYRPDAISATLGSWSSNASSYSASDRCPVSSWKDVKATNKNNNSSETITINTPSTSTMPFSTSTDECRSLNSNKTSSSSVIPKSSSSEGVCSSKDISSNDTQRSKDTFLCKDTVREENTTISTNTCCIESITSGKAPCSSSTTTCRSIDDEDNPRWNRYKYYQAMYQAEPTAAQTENHLSDTFLEIQPVMFLILHILLIASCVFAMLWSVSSTQGLCWNAFWEWVATAIIAILIQAVILDPIKAALMTFIQWYYYYDEVKPRPYSDIR